MRVKKPKKERKKERKNVHAVTENIHTPPPSTEGIGISWGMGLWAVL